MSKSLGNFAYAHEVLEEFDAETVRYFYLARHYRKPLDYSKEGFEEARKALARVHTLIDEVSSEFVDSPQGEISTVGRSFIASLDPYRKRYIAEMDDDLNTVGAIGAIQEIVSETNRFRATAATKDRPALREAIALIRKLGYPLGLFQEKDRTEKGIQDELIRLLIDLRGELREKKEFALSDSIRDRLAELGITLKDTAQGTIWIN
jgi:cysteinyl-tRNA synthetase